MEDKFAEIAMDYDRIFLRDLEADRGMLVAFLERHGARTVLDCACGTGVHTEILAREGYEVVGSDASARMLEAARAKLSAAHLAVDLYESYWSDLPERIAARFDAVICMGNSLALEADDGCVVASLRGMRSMLNDGGVLLISATNADRQLAEPVAIEVVEPEPDCFLMLVRDLKADTTTHRFFFIDAAGSEPTMKHFRFDLLNLTAAKLEECLRRASIERFTLYGDKDFSPYSSLESERLIMVAEK